MGWRAEKCRERRCVSGSVRHGTDPLVESVLRRVFHTGIPAATSIVQHNVLVVGMLGGAIAAREGRLLSLSTLGETSLHGRLKTVSRFFTSSVSAAVSGFLCVAAYQFVRTEQGAGKILAYGIPVWVVEWVLPVGFGAIAIRILLHTSPKWGTRSAAAAFTILLAAVAIHWPGGFHHLVPIALGTLFVISLLGAPAFVTLGGATLILFGSADQPIAAIPVAHYMLVTNLRSRHCRCLRSPDIFLPKVAHQNA